MAIMASSWGGATAKGGHVNGVFAVGHAVEPQQGSLLIHPAVVADVISGGAIHRRVPRGDGALQHNFGIGGDF